MEGVEGVLEAAAVACPPPGGGPDQLTLFLVMRPGAAEGLSPGQLRDRCQAAISAKLNPLFKVGVKFGWAVGRPRLAGLDPPAAGLSPY